MLFVPAFALSFCGSREPWAHGTVAILAGVSVLAWPQRIRIPLMLLAPTLLALILSSTAFLPASWFAEQEWRKVIQRDFGVSLSSFHSPQPWVSFECWLLLLVGIVWFFNCLGRSFSERERRFALQTMTLVIAVISATAVAFHCLKIEVPFWRSVWRVNYYGPFPNRNNFSGLVTVGAVLALATTLDAYRRKSLSWVIFGLALLPIFSALLLNTSRMGVLLFFSGISTWMLIATMEKRTAQRLAVGISVLLILTSFFLLFGQHIIARFTQNVDLLTTISNDGRVRIFKDAFAVLVNHPIAGVGLGNFETFFALSSEAPPAGTLITRALHPENDWLWFAVESGIPALIAVFIAFFALVSSFKTTHTERKNSSRKDLRFRYAAAVSVGLLAIQGLVDTPLHTIGLITLGALMAGIALNPKRSVVITNPLSSWLSRASGGVCIIIGTSWIAIATGHPLLPGTAAGKLYAQQSQTFSQQGDNAAAIELLDKAIKIQPLQWNYYFDRAQIKLRHGLPFQDALNDFAVTRFFEPNHAELCIREMEIWLAYSPPLAIPAVREAMNRDRNSSYSYYQSIVNSLYTHPELRSAVRDLATDPKLKLIYLANATSDDFNEVLQDLLANFPVLQCFTGPEKVQIFKLWYARGDKTLLISRLESNIDWQKVGWPVLAAHLAVKSEFENACQLVFKNLHPPAFVSPRKADLAELERNFLHNTTDVVRGLELYEMQKNKGLWDPALITLRQITELPKFPDQVHYERALMLYRKKEYAKAWEALNLYMSKVDVLSS